MSKLYISNKGINVPIAELGLVLNKEQALLGNLERDLVLMTAGNIKIQVGNKFYDLPFTTIDNNGNGTVINGAKVVIIDKVTDLPNVTYPGDGSFVYIKETKAFYIAIDNGYVLLTSDPDGEGSNKVYLSFNETQDLTGDQKRTVIMNTGTVLNQLGDIGSLTSTKVYNGMVVFAIAEGKHYQLVDTANSTLLTSWKELYLSLRGGSAVEGSIIVNQGELHLNSIYQGDYLPSNAIGFDGVSLGSSDYLSGLAYWKTVNNIIFSSQDDNTNGFKFITRGSTPGYFTPLSLSDNKVGLSGAIDYNYDVTVNGLSTFKSKAEFNTGFKSPDFMTGINGTGYDLSKDSQGKWTLEVDKVITRDSVNTNKNQYKTQALDGNLIANYSTVLVDVDLVETIEVIIQGSAAGRYSDASGTVMPLENKSRLVNLLRIPLADIELDSPVKQTELVDLAFGIGDRVIGGGLVSYTTYVKQLDNSYTVLSGTVTVDTINVYEVTTNTNLTAFTVGDMLYYKEWNADKLEMRGTYVEVVAITATSLILYSYNGNVLNSTDTLIKVGNRYAQECFMQFNSSDRNSPFLEVVNNIDNFNDFVENFYYAPFENETLDDIYNNTFSATQVRVRQGRLADIADTRLGLTAAPQEGFYSDNAYIRGNFDSVRHMMGNQLSFISGVLTIVDLETIKSRTITGANGLNGGGNLFAGNIVINHNGKNWVDKTALSGGDVISNLVVDTYGHPTDWVTRTLTTTEITEGTRLYYTDTRVDARVDPKIATGATIGANTTGSATKWSGLEYEGTPFTGTPGYVMVWDATASKYKPGTAAAINTFIGSPSGGATLQSITDTGNTTTSGISIAKVTGEIFRADAASGAMRLVAHQTGVDMQGLLSINGDVNITGSIIVPDGYNHSWGGTYAAGKPTISAVLASGIVFYPTGVTDGEQMKLNTTGLTVVKSPEVTTAGEGIILKSPDGTRYKVTVANGGTVAVVAI